MLENIEGDSEYCNIYIVIIKIFFPFLQSKNSRAKGKMLNRVNSYTDW